MYFTLFFSNKWNCVSINQFKARTILKDFYSITLYNRRKHLEHYSTLFLDLFPGVYLSKEKQVFQEPSELLLKPKDEVKLSFRHEIQSYDTILWYQRSAGDTALKLIAYIYYEDPKVESPFNRSFKVSGDGRKTAYLHILNLRHPEDSGEYFGAASMHSNKDSDSLVQKPP